MPKQHPIIIYHTYHYRLEACLQLWTVPKRTHWRRNLTLEDTLQVSSIMLRFQLKSSSAMTLTQLTTVMFCFPQATFTSAWWKSLVWPLFRRAILLFRLGGVRGHVVYHYISVILAFQFASHSQRLKVICGCLGCHFIRLSNNSVFFFHCM